MILEMNFRKGNFNSRSNTGDIKSLVHFIRIKGGAQ
jgi:hypothetical protein